MLPDVEDEPNCASLTLTDNALPEFSTDISFLSLSLFVLLFFFVPVLC